MEHFSRSKLSDFYSYAIRYDLSILINRRQAYNLFVSAFEERGAIQLSDELVDKLLTFLRLDETQYGGPNTTSLYASVKHLSEIRKALRAAGVSAAGLHSTAPTPRESEAGDAGPPPLEG